MNDSKVTRWKMVPVEPTQEMLNAGKNAHFEAEQAIHEDWQQFGLRGMRAAHVYRAMLSAAPTTPAPEQAVPETDLIAALMDLRDSAGNRNHGADRAAAIDELRRLKAPEQAECPKCGDIRVITTVARRCLACESEVSAAPEQAEQPAIELTREFLPGLAFAIHELQWMLARSRSDEFKACIPQLLAGLREYQKRAETMPEQDAVKVPRELLEGVIFKADNLLESVNNLLQYAGSTAAGNHPCRRADRVFAALTEMVRLKAENEALRKQLLASKKGMIELILACHEDGHVTLEDDVVETLEAALKQ